ncbi:MAG: hypothetical protein C0615_05375 [Desulfuromonas sp.]|nr:MAG: hypothetical protein C0615_05375 [Desulfuromonas sp.]
MADIAENFHRLDLAMLRDCMCRHGSGLELLSAPFRPERCETIKPDHVSNILEMLNQLYEVIFIDCTSMFVNPSEVEAFRGSETIFIVTDLSVPALRNASRLAHYINGLGISHDRIEYVANRFHKGGALGLSQAEETLGKRIFWLFPNDYDDVVTSINEGKPVAQLAPHSTISESIKGFIDRLLNPKADTKFRGMRGRFGKAL